VDSEVEGLEYVPDGGKEAWLVVLGPFLGFFASAGTVNAYVTFQDYYESTLLPSSSSSSISLIGPLQVFFSFFPGTITGRIFDAYGTRVSVITHRSVICVFSLMMVSLCQKDQAYQVFLAHGVLFSIGIPLLFSPSVAVLGHWSRKKRALSIGLTTGSSASGGVIMPIILEQLTPVVGLGWAVRIAAFMLMACLTIHTRLPLSWHISFGTAIVLGSLKDSRYTLATIGAFLLFYGFFIPYFYIHIYTKSRGVPLHIANHLVAILNAMNVTSRIIPGYLADKTQPLHPCGRVCSVLILGLWLPSHNAASITAFTALYGLFSAFSALLLTYIASISPQEVYGAWLGSVYMVVAVATLIGTPTGGALLKKRTTNISGS
ncbi:major facilitator superfamily domain-containing protein, partial [Trametes elegans]